MKFFGLFAVFFAILIFSACAKNTGEWDSYVVASYGHRLSSPPLVSACVGNDCHILSCEPNPFEESYFKCRIPYEFEDYWQGVYAVYLSNHSRGEIYGRSNDGQRRLELCVPKTPVKTKANNCYCLR